MNTELNNVLLAYNYEVLKDKIYSIINYLSQSIESLNDIDGVLVNKFSVDDSLVKSIKVSEINEILKSRVSYLNNTIIPSINEKINSLK